MIPMKKRLFGTLLVAALVVTQVVSVFVAGSKTTQATPSGESAGKYEMIESTTENFAEAAVVVLEKNKKKSIIGLTGSCYNKAL